MPTYHTKPGWAQEYRIEGTAKGFLRGYAGTITAEGIEGCIPGSGIAGASGTSIVSFTGTFGPDPMDPPMVYIRTSNGTDVTGQAGFYVITRDGFGGGDTAAVTQAWTFPKNITHTYTAEWFMSFSEVELEFAEDDLDAGILGPNGFDDYFGTGENEDGIFPRRLIARRIARAGETVTVECEIIMDGGTPVVVTSTHTLSSDYVISDYQTTGIIYAGSSNYIGLGELTWQNLDKMWTGGDYDTTITGTPSKRAGRVQVLGDNLITARCTTGTGAIVTDGCDTNRPTGELLLTVVSRPRRRHQYMPHVSWIDGSPHTAGLTTTWISKASGGTEFETDVVLDGSGEGDSTIDQWDIQAEYRWMGGSPVTIRDLSEWAAPRAWLDTDSLSAEDEDPRDYLMLFQGTPWQAFELKHIDFVLPHTFTPSGDNLTWSGGMQYLEGARYLKIDTDTAGSIRFTNSETAEDRKYSFGTGVTVIDLCTPKNYSDEIDVTETRFPLKSSILPPETPGEYYGLCAYDTILIEYSASGATLTSLKALGWDNVDNDQSVGNIMTEYGYDRLAWTSETDHTYVQCGLLLDACGRTTEVAANYCVRPTTGDPYWTFYSISAYLTFLNARKCWTATEYTTFPDTYHTNDMYGYWIGGNGWINLDGDWVFGTDDYTDTDKDVWACALWAQVDIPPGVGDLWLGTNFPGPLPSDADVTVPLYSGKILRGCGIGLVINKTTPYDAQDITLLTHPADVSAGVDTTDVRGWYETGTPFGEGNINHKTRWDDKPLVTVHYKIKNRWHHRRCFNLAQLLRLLSIARADDYEICVGMNDETQTDYTQFWGTSPSNLLDNYSVTGLETASSHYLHYFYHGTFVGSDLTITRKTTVIATITTTDGTCPAIAVFEDGEIWAYWLEDDAVYHAKYSAAGDALQTRIATNVTSGVDSGGLAVTTTETASGRPMVVLATIESGILNVRSATDGITFS